MNDLRWYSLDTDKITTLDEVKLILGTFDLTLTSTAKNFDKLTYLLKDYPEKKVCPHKIDGVCPNHNIFCIYPKCEQ